MASSPHSGSAFHLSQSFYRCRLLSPLSFAATPKPYITRRPLLLLSPSLSISSLSFPSIAASPPPPPPPSSPDTTITDRVFIDFSLCPTSLYSEQTLDTSSVEKKLKIVFPCSDPEFIGRVIIGLYGKHLPLTVANFKSMCTGAPSYKGNFVHKIFPRQFFLAGRQGRLDKGGIIAPRDLALNTETIESEAFSVKHSRGGLVSLCLSENDDDDEIKLDPDYHNVEFLITTGPGPFPQLDDKNIVFGTVVEGMDVVASIDSIPTVTPGEEIRQFNNLAAFFGDERARVGRSTWDRPLKTVFISGCGELRVAKPSLSPSLP